MLIEPTRELLRDTGKPWVIENVMGAKLAAGWLCGQMFSLPFFRHRAFETSWFWMQPGHPKHLGTIKKGRMLGERAQQIVAQRKTRANTISHAPKWVFDTAKEAMSIDWMKQDELSQAIPPAYMRYIGEQLMRTL